jgi:hypothetical protein
MESIYHSLESLLPTAPSGEPTAAGRRGGYHWPVIIIIIGGGGGKLFEGEPFFSLIDRV